MATEDLFHDRGEDTSRVGALSDGIFAVALTLLVLDLKVPDPVARGTLGQAILALGPKLWSYGLTFAVVGAYWISHHRMLHDITYYTRTLLWLNLLFLALIALVPVPTALVGRGFSLTLADAQIAWIAYSGTLSLIAVSQFSMWRYALSRNLVEARVSRRLAGYLGARTLVPAAVFIFSIGLSFASPLLGRVSPILIPPALAIVHHSYARPRTPLQ